MSHWGGQGSFFFFPRSPCPSDLDTHMIQHYHWNQANKEPRLPSFFCSSQTVSLLPFKWGLPDLRTSHFRWLIHHTTISWSDRQCRIKKKTNTVLQVCLIVSHNCNKTQLSIQREQTIAIMLPHSYAKLCPHSHRFNSLTSGSVSTSDSSGPAAQSEPSPAVSQAQVLALLCYLFSHFLTTHGSLFHI